MTIPQKSRNVIDQLPIIWDLIGLAEDMVSRMDCDCDGAPDGGGICYMHQAEQILDALDKGHKNQYSTVPQWPDA